MSTQGPAQQGYDGLAERYAEQLFDELDRKPLDRALLTGFAEQRGPGAVVDVGCGPGHVTRHLSGLGLTALGLDLSPGMVTVARRRTPGLEFHEASMLALPVRDDAWVGLLALYSIIHVTPTERPPPTPSSPASCSRAASPLVAFHVGKETRHVEELWGERVSLHFHLLQPADVLAGLEAAGLTIEMHLAPTPGEADTRCAYVLASTRL